jgi:hypothetical protein
MSSAPTAGTSATMPTHWPAPRSSTRRRRWPATWCRSGRDAVLNASPLGDDGLQKRLLWAPTIKQPPDRSDVFPRPAVAGLATLAVSEPAPLWWPDYCSKVARSALTRSASTAAGDRSAHPKCEDGDKQGHADQENGYLGSRVHAGASGARGCAELPLAIPRSMRMCVRLHRIAHLLTSRLRQIRARKDAFGVSQLCVLSEQEPQAMNRETGGSNDR